MPSSALFDTHCHLDASPLGDDVPAALARARAAGVERILVPGTAPSQWDGLPRLRALDLARVSLAVGVHPQCLAELTFAAREEALAALERCARSLDAVAIGECGLDGETARREGVSLEEQARIVRAHAEVAERLGLPLIVHAHGAIGATLALFESLGPRRHGAILHAFGGPAELVPRFVRLGFFFGIGPSITWPRARRPKEAARAVPLDRVLLETDAPGTHVHGSARRSGEPSELRAVLDALAEVRGTSGGELAAHLSDNAARLFAPER
ncbi:MAG: TatD family hydrolase [Sandaracinaceae bacterium]|nr:TatD family hydrolase [Sandaracinaceae bacterium]